MTTEFDDLLAELAPHAGWDPKADALKAALFDQLVEALEQVKPVLDEHRVTVYDAGDGYMDERNNDDVLSALGTVGTVLAIAARIQKAVGVKS